MTEIQPDMERPAPLRQQEAEGGAQIDLARQRMADEARDAMSVLFAGRNPFEQAIQAGVFAQNRVIDRMINGGGPDVAGQPYLGSNVWTNRATAHARLERMGMAAAEPLARAMTNNDPEISTRARQILERTLENQPTALLSDLLDHRERTLSVLAGRQLLSRIEASGLPQLPTAFAVMNKNAPFEANMTSLRALANVQDAALPGRAQAAQNLESMRILFPAVARTLGLNQEEIARVSGNLEQGATNLRLLENNSGWTWTYMAQLQFANGRAEDGAASILEAMRRDPQAGSNNHNLMQLVARQNLLSDERFQREFVRLGGDVQQVRGYRDLFKKEQQ